VCPRADAVRARQKAPDPPGETGIVLPNNQRQHRTSHAPKDVLPLRICANYCAPWQTRLDERLLLRLGFGETDRSWFRIMCEAARLRRRALRRSSYLRPMDFCITRL